MTEADTSQTSSPEHSGRLRDPIWQFLSVVVALISLSVASFTAYDVQAKASKRKDLSIERAYSASVVSVQEALGGDLQLLYEGESISCASVLGLHFENTGNTMIMPADFVSPIKIAVAPPSRIIAARVDAADPEDLQPRFAQPNLSEITLTPLLLNPSDAFGVELTVVDLCEPDGALVSVEGRVAGVKDIGVTTRVPESGILHGLQSAYATEAMIIIPVATLLGFLLLWFWPKPWDWIETIFGRRPRTIWGRISLNLAIATLVAITFEDVVEGIVQIAKEFL